ncbi:MAG: protein kinase [Planctomycetia bacterium]|nr:protein kinase [Planctomycetia bacterium]
MLGDFHREYLVRLPLPLAQLYSRAYNAKDPRSRHDNTFYLFEALIKLAATPLVAAYVEGLAQGGPHVEAIDKQLSQLVLPSLGQWSGILRELARYYGNRSDGKPHPLDHLWRQLDEPRRDLPAVSALYRRIKNGADGAASGDKSCSLLQVFDSLVQYRNGVFGHGAGRFESFYGQEMGPLLFPAANEVLGDGVLDLLGPRGSRLVFLTDVSVADEHRMDIGMRELIGLQSERMTPLSIARAESASLAPNRVAVVWPGRNVPLRLDPMLMYRESELSEELLFLNRDRQGRHVEYLSYTTGRTDRDPLSSASLAALLGHVTGRKVTEGELETLAAEFDPSDGGGSGDAATPSQQAAQAEAAPPTRIMGDYEILAEIGRGGMGVVYLARQRSLGRLVALKMLPADLADDEIALARFRREIRHLARCEHPNIVKVLGSGTMDDGQLYYTMEYVPGSDLELVWRELSGSHRHGDASSLGSTSFARAILSASRKRREAATRAAGKSSTATGSGGTAAGAAAGLEGIPELALPPLPELPSHAEDPGGYVRRVVALMRDAARALQTVHEQQIVHRDIKPSNLMLTPDGARVVLMDFGLAKGQSVAPSITRQGGLQGTLRYAAPEQLAAAKLKVGPAADVRGLGVSMWELLTRKRLFEEANDEIQLATMVYDTDVPRLRSVDTSLDRDLEAIVSRATERRAADRIQSAGELADYLDLYLEGKPLPIRPPSTAEMVGRWIRGHRPLVASASAAVLLVLITAVVAFAMVNQARLRAERLAKENKILADNQTELAKKETDARQAAESALTREAQQRDRAEKALEEAERNLYLSNIVQAHREWKDNNVLRSRELLTLCPEKQREWEWYYLSNLYQGGRLVIDAHPGGANCVAVTRDGKRLVSGGADKLVKLWNLRSGELLKKLSGHTAEINSVATSLDGRWIASAGEDRVVKLWDAATGEEKRTCTGAASGVTCVTFSPDSKLMMAGSRDLKMRIWKLDDESPPIEVKAADEIAFMSVAAQPKGLMFVGGGRSPYLTIFRLPTGENLGKQFMGDPFLAYSVAWHPDNYMLAVGNMATRILDLSQDKDDDRMRTLSTGDDKVLGVAFSPDGKYLTSGSMRRQVRLWQRYKDDGKDRWRDTRTWQGHTDAVTGVTFTTDSDEVVSSSKDGTVRVWPLTDVMQGHTDRVTAVATSPDGKTIASAGFDGTVRIWDQASRKLLHTLKGHTGPVNCVAFSPDGKTVASGSEDHTARIWDPEGERSVHTLSGHRGAVMGIAFRPDGKQVATAGDDGAVKCWGVARGAWEMTFNVAMTYNGPKSGLLCIGYLPGNRIVVGGRDKLVRIVNLGNSSLERTLKGHTDTISCLAITPDGKQLATGSWDQTVRQWDPATGQEVRVLRGHPGSLYAVAFSPNGHRLVSSDAKLTVKVWETGQGHELVTFTGTKPSFLGLAFNPDGRGLVLGGDDDGIHLWSAP